MKCSIENCTAVASKIGMCHAHYKRHLRGVDLHNPPIVRKLRNTEHAERLRLYAPPSAPDECWNWTRSLNKGYGVFSPTGGGTRGAHIIAWELANRMELPKGMIVRHTCDNRRCCNPAHLLLGTKAENSADMVERQRQSRGVDRHNAKLTEDDVREIRRRYASGETQKAIAQDYGMEQTNISFIVRRKTWAHVD